MALQSLVKRKRKDKYKMIYRYLCILLVFVFNSGIIVSQQNLQTSNSKNLIEHKCLDQMHELVYLHLSKRSVMAGDQLLFKAYIISKNKKRSINSKILYLQVVDSKGKIFAYARASINNMICQSSINIPDSLSSGLYKLVAYTNFMRNFPPSTFSSTYLIIVGNKYESEIMQSGDKIESHHAVQTESKPDSSQKGYLQSIDDKEDIQLKMSKQSYSKSEKAVVSLKVKGENKKWVQGSYSLSVSEKLPDEAGVGQTDITSLINCYGIDTSCQSSNISRSYRDLITSSYAYKNWNNISGPGEMQNILYKPENINYLLEGIVSSKITKKPLRGETVLLSSPDSLAILKYRFTDSLGRFAFALDNMFDNRKLLLSLNSEKEFGNYSFAIDEKRISDSSFCFPPLAPPQALNSYYYKCKKLALFNKVFNKKELETSSVVQRNNRQRFYGAPNYIVHMADYLVEFDDFNDICKNTLPGVRIKKKANKKSIQMFDLNHQVGWKRPCFILLDNVPFYDIDYLVGLGSQQISYIEVCYRHIAYGDIDFYGILAIFTKDKQVLANGHSIILENKVAPDFTNIIGSSVASEKMLKPNFNQLLYWNPNVPLDPASENLIEFNTSDLATEYLIEIQGVDANGNPVSCKMEFKVQ
jgi:hypothetical protein